MTLFLRKQDLRVMEFWEICWTNSWAPCIWIPRHVLCKVVNSIWYISKESVSFIEIICYLVTTKLASHHNRPQTWCKSVHPLRLDLHFRIQKDRYWKLFCMWRMTSGLLQLNQFDMVTLDDWKGLYRLHIVPVYAVMGGFCCKQLGVSVHRDILHWNSNLVYIFTVLKNLRNNF